MPIQVSNDDLPAWADGDQVLYNDYVMTIANGGILQIGLNQFMFRSNLRLDILEWLMIDCTHDGELFTNNARYLSKIQFNHPAGAMEFKLRWM